MTYTSISLIRAKLICISFCGSHRENYLESSLQADLETGGEIVCLLFI